MKSSIKKALSTLLSGAILFSGILSYSASASGNVNMTKITKVGSKVKVTYSYDVDGNFTDSQNRRRNEYKYGNFACDGFAITGRKVVTFKFGGASYSGARFEICKQDTDGGITDKDAPVATIDIPKASVGMPTLSRDITLPTGKYSVRVVSKSEPTSSKGTVIICYADAADKEA